jgi:hypothetical protein
VPDALHPQIYYKDFSPVQKLVKSPAFHAYYYKLGIEADADKGNL